MENIDKGIRQAQWKLYRWNTAAWALTLTSGAFYLALFTPWARQHKDIAKWFPLPSLAIGIVGSVVGSRTDKIGDYLMMVEGAQTLNDQSQLLRQLFPDITLAEISGDPVADVMLNKLSEFKVNVKFLGVKSGYSFDRYKFEPKAGQKIDELEKYCKDIQSKLKCPKPPLISDNITINIDVPRKDRQFIPYLPTAKPKGGIVGLIGYDIDGNQHTCDFADPSNSHLFVGGFTGSGKTEFLVTLMASLIDWHTPEQVKIACIDTKATDFGFTRQLGKYQWQPTTTDLEPSVHILKSLVGQMEKRKKLLGAADCANITVFNEQHPDKAIPHIFLFNDEVTDLTACSDKEIQKPAVEYISLLARKGRALGIHLVIGTQKPLAKHFPSEIKDNLPVKVCMMTTTKANGKLIAGHILSSHNLLGKGDGFYVQPGCSPVRIQSSFVRDRLTIGEALPTLKPVSTLPLADPREHIPTSEEVTLIKDVWEEHQTWNKTIKEVWGISKNGTKGSKYQKARQTLETLVSEGFKS